ncbi:MAG: hypothetical protein IAE87_05320 [Rhodobacteraceae bacterium]|jgi:hypothetical protein|nr:hypothetical protein [Paracoccaceae bacterium]
MKEKAVLLLCVAILFALMPFMLPARSGGQPGDSPVAILHPSMLETGYIFAIWIAIHAGLLAHAVYGLGQHHSDPAWDQPRTALMAAMFCGTFWLAFAGSNPVIATGLVLIMLGFALAAALRAPRVPRWLALSPIALFAGWTTAAAAAAAGITLAGLGWLSDSAAALAGLLAVLVVAVGMQIRLGPVPEYGAAVILTMIGIAIASGNATVFWVALAGAAAMAAVTLATARSTSTRPTST